MTKQDVHDLIINKEIPIRFDLDVSTYDLFVYVESFGSTSLRAMFNVIDIFPNWFNRCDLKNKIKFENYQLDVIFQSQKLTFEECLGEFLFWFEINKNRFTNIQYYE